MWVCRQFGQTVWFGTRPADNPRLQQQQRSPSAYATRIQCIHSRGEALRPDKRVYPTSIECPGGRCLAMRVRNPYRSHHHREGIFRDQGGERWIGGPSVDVGAER